MGGNTSPAAGGAEMFCPTCSRSYAPPKTLCPADQTLLVKLSATTSGDHLIGKELDGRYTIRAKLGEGGMGAVYRAMQHSVGREVALKVITPGVATDREAVKRFLREAKLSSRLSAPTVITVLDFGQSDDGLLYLAMELVDGDTLNDLIRKQGPFSLKRVVRIGTQLCDALEAAHQLNIVHRDLKPSNVMVLRKPEGRDLIKVLDFGLARSLESQELSLTGSGLVMGTPHFIAPEQAMAKPVDSRADLYSTGVMLYQLLNGYLPFPDLGTFAEVIARQVTQRPAPMLPGTPPVVENLILRLLAVNPEERPRSAAVLHEQLLALDVLTPSEPSPSVSSALGAAPTVRSRPLPTSSRLPFVVMGIATVLGVAGGVGYAVLHEKQQPAFIPPAPLVVVEPAPAPAPTRVAKSEEPPPPKQREPDPPAPNKHVKTRPRPPGEPPSPKPVVAAPPPPAPQPSGPVMTP